MLLHLLILLLLTSDSVMMMPLRHFRTTSLDDLFIRNAKSFCRTLLTLTFPLSFTVGDESHCVMSRSHVLSCLSRSSTLTYMHEIDRSAPLFFTRIRGMRIPILVVSVWELCPGMSSCLFSVNALLLGVSISLHHVDLLLKVLDSWTWWWHLFYILFLTITPSLSLVLDFCITSWASHYRFSLSLHSVYHRCSFRFDVPW